MNWKRVFAFLFFSISFTLTVLFFAGVFKPPFWFIAYLLVVSTLRQFVRMVEEE